MKVIFYKFCPLLVVISIWFIFSSPFFLKAKIPYPSTYQANNFAPWDAYANLHGPVKNAAMPDVITQIYPWKHLTIESLRHGQIPFWNQYSFDGTPHLANYQSAVFTPFNILFFLFSFENAWSMLILLQPLLAGVFIYAFVRSLGISKFGGTLCAVSFMFCGFITVWMDYGTLAYAILYLPLSLFAIEKYYQKDAIGYLVLLAFTIVLSFFSGHFQISLYFFLFILLYQMYKYIQVKNNSTAIVILVYSGFGIFMSLPQIFPSLEFYSQSFRSTLYQKGEVIPWQYLPTFLAPDFYGNPVTRNDWFGHYAEWNAYIGLLPFMLSLYALKKKSPFVMFLFSVSILFLLFTFFTPLLDVLIALHIPVVSTSAVSRIIILYCFGFIVLAGFGFDELLKDIQKKKWKSIILWLAAFSVVFVLLWLVVLLKINLSIDKIAIAKQNLILPSFLFIAFVFSIFGYIFLQKFEKKCLLQVFSISCILFVCFDMLRFATKWQPFDPKSLTFVQVPVTKSFGDISGYQRVIGNFGAEAAVYYQLPSLEGYDALYIPRIGQFMTSLTDGKVTDAARSVVMFPRNGKNAPKAINLLNVQYIVHKVSDDYTNWTYPYWKFSGNQFKRIYDDGAYRIYKNTAVFPRAYLVSQYTVKRDPQIILTSMFADTFDLRKQIVLEKDPQIVQQKENAGTVVIQSFTANTIKLSTSSSSDSLLFLSDPYYPGWRATVDNSLTEILRADYAFRAIKVPKGNHIIYFQYTPDSFIVGIYLALVGFICLIAMTLWYRKISIFARTIQAEKN